MDWIVTTGETVEAALENALDELSVTADDVEYEVLQEPKKTLFGFRNTEAQIKTRVRPVAAPAKRERRRPARSEKRKKTKAHRPKPKSTSGKQKQQRRSPKQQSQEKQPAQKQVQSSNNANNNDASKSDSSTRKRTLTTQHKTSDKSNIRSTSTDSQTRPAAKEIARRTRKIDH